MFGPVSRAPLDNKGVRAGQSTHTGERGGGGKEEGERKKGCSPSTRFDVYWVMNVPLSCLLCQSVHLLPLCFVFVVMVADVVFASFALFCPWYSLIIVCTGLVKGHLFDCVSFQGI